jgi:hypothetical protein
LFLEPFQTFVNGDDLKNDLRKLDALYSALPEDELKIGLINFARHPPEDISFLTTQLWDKYMPTWRSIMSQPRRERDPETDKKLIEELDQLTESPELTTHDERDVDNLSYVTIYRDVRLRKGKWRRFSEESEQRMREAGKIR